VRFAVRNPAGGRPLYARPVSDSASAGRDRPLRTPANRVIQGLLLGAGAALLEFSAGANRIDFFWTPLIIGVTYLLAAAVDGPRGGYWATALALTGWGLAVAYVGAAQPLEIDVAGAYLAGTGAAVAVAAALRTRGFLVSEAGLGLTIAASGLVLAFSSRADALVDATTYAAALGLVAALTAIGGAWQLTRRG